MQELNDATLVAYLDGELADAEQRSVEDRLDTEPAARERLEALARSADLLCRAFDAVTNEPVPERLVAAARGADPTGLPRGARILPFARARAAVRPGMAPRRRLGLTAAAAAIALMIGGGAGYYGSTAIPGGAANGARAAATASLDDWLDNAAGNYRLLVDAGGKALVDVPATGDTRAELHKISQSLPQDVRLPDLKPWGLTFEGARLVVVGGRPAAQLVYHAGNKASGPLALIIGTSKQPDLPATFVRRQKINMLYWRHRGHSYVLVGEINVGYMWGIANDVAWQLDAI